MRPKRDVMESENDETVTIVLPRLKDKERYRWRFDGFCRTAPPAAKADWSEDGVPYPILRFDYETA